MLKTCSDTQRLTLHGPTMGTRWSVTCDAAQVTDVQSLQLVLASAVQEVDTQMSPWLPQSDLNRLNHASPGPWLPLPPQILEVLKCALDICRLSHGAFDPAMGSLVDAWGFGPVRDTPDATAIRAATEVARPPTYDALELDLTAGRARKHAPLQLDLCGIAKGYAVDRMTSVLEQQGVSSALVALDGELRALGTQSSGQPWAVALERPDAGRRAVHSVVELQDLAVATSGDYRRYLEVGNVRLSHTMDARTFAPVRNEVASVTVLARTCMHADAWATALLVAGPGEGLALAQRMGLEALWLLRRGGGLVTLGLGRFAGKFPSTDVPQELN
ncbi:FAD:protein FMN transferase [Ottowia caeni]|uniref:FAD:protein FMN transferase n=1 Tax=Ottowia caeni TaxID=2870339 RepID=UPI001E53DC91|nr:FAD:protein FMN transferase [Ottowia caeni]